MGSCLQTSLTKHLLSFPAECLLKLSCLNTWLSAYCHVIFIAFTFLLLQTQIQVIPIKFWVYIMYSRPWRDKMEHDMHFFFICGANFAVMSELGRYPFYLDISKAMLKYWHRLENLDRNSLLYDALECSRNMEECYNSWYNSIKQFSELLNIPFTSWYETILLH